MKKTILLLLLIISFNANACVVEKMDRTPILLNNIFGSISVKYTGEVPVILSIYDDYKIYEGFLNLNIKPVEVHDIRVDRLKTKFPALANKTFYEYDFGDKIIFTITSNKTIEARRNSEVIEINLEQLEEGPKKQSLTGCSDNTVISY